MERMDSQFKYFAFISYNSRDTEWGRRVQRKLEHYRMPATLCSEHGWARTPIKPVFFAPTDIQPGGLTEEIQERLRASRNLIVICSPHSAQSEWVGKEIAFFHQLGRTNQIYFFIVEGEPHSGHPETECFNPIVETLGLPEILGANIHERIYRLPWLNRERAYVQLISKLLGVEFDAIWRRHRRLLVQKIIAWALGILAIVAALAAVWAANQPADVSVSLEETSVRNDMLPPRGDALVTLFLDNETKIDTLYAQSDNLVFANLPHRYLNHAVRMTVSCRDFIYVDTTLVLTNPVKLALRRDPSVYGDVHFRLWNPRTERFVPDVSLEIAGSTVSSDADGRVSLFIPLESQRASYPISASIPLADSAIHLPCGPDDVVLVEE